MFAGAVTARPVARSARAAQSLRSEVNVRSMGPEADTDAEEDIAANAASAPGRSEHTAADLRRAWWSKAACPPSGGDGDKTEHIISSCSLKKFKISCADGSAEF